ncbi:MAG: glutamate N-acetyltransferase/amino-acid acetyltransferase, partial [Actinomycetota bacterium]
MTVQLPQGFSSFVTNVGVKDESKDFTVVLGQAGTTSAGVFTQSRFAGPSVLLSRRYLNGANRAMVVLSKNANVATGDEGMQNAVEIAGSVADKLGITS